MEELLQDPERPEVLGLGGGAESTSGGSRGEHMGRCARQRS